VDDFRYRLDKLIHPDSTDKNFKLIRTLTEDERRFIQNELLMSKINYPYWATHYAWIKTDKGFEDRIRFWESQEMILSIISNLEEAEKPILLINLKARQIGASTIYESILTHRVITTPSVTAILAADEPGQSEFLFNMMERFYNHLPWWMKPHREFHVKGTQMFFDQIDSLIIVDSGNRRQGGIGQGKSVQLGHLSELATWQYPDMITEDLMPAIESGMSPRTFFVMESTAKGEGNDWHNWWRLAKRNKFHGFTPIFIPWYAIKEKYAANPPGGWVPTSVTEGMRASLRGSRGVEITNKQSYWWEKTFESYREDNKLNEFYSEYCVDGDARVGSAVGIRSLAKSIGTSMTEAAITEGTIVNHKKMGSQNVIELQTKNGRRLKLTPEHRVGLDSGEWREASQLKPGDRIKLTPPMFSTDMHGVDVSELPCVKSMVSIDVGFARFLGYFMGDGCFYKDKVLIVCDSKDEDVIQDVASLIRMLFGKEPKLERFKGHVNIFICDIRLKSIFKALGLISPKPHVEGRSSGYKRKVCVPECIWLSPKPVIKEFLRSLFECDGHSYPYTTRVNLFSAKEDFIRDIQLLLLGFGINGEILIANKIAGDGHKYIGRKLELAANATLVFFNEIGFIGSRKNNTFKVRTKGRNGKPHEMIDVVIATNPAGLCEVYDITVDKSHSFGANGILVHNCSDDEESFQSSGRSVFPMDKLMKLRQQAMAMLPKVEMYEIQERG